MPLCFKTEIIYCVIIFGGNSLKPELKVGFSQLALFLQETTQLAWDQDKLTSQFIAL